MIVKLISVLVFVGLVVAVLLLKGYLFYTERIKPFKKMAVTIPFNLFYHSYIISPKKWKINDRKYNIAFYSPIEYSAHLYDQAWERRLHWEEYDGFTLNKCPSIDERLSSESFFLKNNVQFVRFNFIDYLRYRHFCYDYKRNEEKQAKIALIQKKDAQTTKLLKSIQNDIGEFLNDSPDKW